MRRAIQNFILEVDFLQAVEVRTDALIRPSATYSGGDLRQFLNFMQERLAKKDNSNSAWFQKWLVGGGGNFTYSVTPTATDRQRAWKLTIRDNDATIECAINYGVINHHGWGSMYLHSLPGEFIVHHDPPVQVDKSGILHGDRVITVGPTLSGRTARYQLQCGICSISSGAETAFTFQVDWATQPGELYEASPSTPLKPQNFQSCWLHLTHWVALIDEK